MFVVRVDGVVAPATSPVTVQLTYPGLFAKLWDRIGEVKRSIILQRCRWNRQRCHEYQPTHEHTRGLPNNPLPADLETEFSQPQPVPVILYFGFSDSQQRAVKPGELQSFELRLESERFSSAQVSVQLTGPPELSICGGAATRAGANLPCVLERETSPHLGGAANNNSALFELGCLCHVTMAPPSFSFQVLFHPVTMADNL